MKYLSTLIFLKNLDEDPANTALKEFSQLNCFDTVIEYLDYCSFKS